jgi:hypothetical protein
LEVERGSLQPTARALPRCNLEILSQNSALNSNETAS